jgi:hypothetical protein
MKLLIALILIYIVYCSSISIKPKISNKIEPSNNYYNLIDNNKVPIVICSYTSYNTSITNKLNNIYEIANKKLLNNEYKKILIIKSVYYQKNNYYYQKNNYYNKILNDYFFDNKHIEIKSITDIDDQYDDTFIIFDNIHMYSSDEIKSFTESIGMFSKLIMIGHHNLNNNLDSYLKVLNIKKNEQFIKHICY